MSTVKAIRERLNLTQQALADGVGCTQGNIWQLERTDKPQSLTAPLAMRLISFARERGLDLTLDQAYGLVPLPPKPEAEAEQDARTT